VVRTKTVTRVDRLREKIGIGCPACCDRPAIHLLGVEDPLPAAFCGACGRRFDDEVLVFLGIDPTTI
jgi:hypothetical protein